MFVMDFICFTISGNLKSFEGPNLQGQYAPPIELNYFFSH
jgi:hypothetical protein